MWNKIKKYILPAFAFVLTLIAALFWVALRINHSGISKFLGADTNPSFLVGRRSLTQQGGTQQDGFTDYVCLSTFVDFTTGRQLSNYVNSQPGIITGYYSFEGEYAYDTFSDIPTEIKRPK